MQHQSNATAVPCQLDTENWSIKDHCSLNFQVHSEQWVVTDSHHSVLYPFSAHWRSRLWRGQEWLAQALSSKLRGWDSRWSGNWQILTLWSGTLQSMDQLCDVSWWQTLAPCQLNLDHRSGELSAFLWPTRDVWPEELWPYFKAICINPRFQL